MNALELYRRAYGVRDAALLATVWPGADTQALSRQFAGVRYQSVSFDRCAVRGDGPDRAVASCAATISSVANENGPDVVRRREMLTFALRRDGREWRIASVDGSTVNR